MIVWINGTFGSGKTTIAHELDRRLEKSIIYDPERFGFVFMKNVPQEIAKSDFQDYPLWREANVKLLKRIENEYDGTIIVPMTLTTDKYFDEIIGVLRRDGVDVEHFTLVASKETIQKRLRKRFEGKQSWAYQQMKGRIKKLESPLFAEHIATDDKTIEEIVEQIAISVNLDLLPDSRSQLRKFIDRKFISVKEARVFK